MQIVYRLHKPSGPEYSNLQWQEQNRPVLHKSDGNFMFILVFLYRVKHFHTHINK